MSIKSTRSRARVPDIWSSEKITGILDGSILSKSLVSRLIVGPVLGIAISNLSRSSIGSIRTATGGLSVELTYTPSSSSPPSSSSKLGVPMTSRICRPRTAFIRRNPRPIACSGRISFVAFAGRRPRTTVMFLTSHPSRRMRTLTTTRIGLFCSSIKRD